MSLNNQLICNNLSQDIANIFTRLQREIQRKLVREERNFDNAITLEQQFTFSRNDSVVRKRDTRKSTYDTWQGAPISPSDSFYRRQLKVEQPAA